MIKRIIMIAAAVMITVPAYSALRISIEPTFGYSTPGDFDPMVVYGGGIGFDIYDNLELGYRYLRGSKTDLGGTNIPQYTTNAINDDKTWKLESHNVFCEYRYLIPFGFPLSITAGGSLGYTKASVKTDWGPSYTDTLINVYEKNDSGIAYSISAGLQFDVTQKISIFAQAGYQGTVYGDKYITEKISTNGMQYLFGVKFNIWGVNKAMYEDY